ncbi:MULTISPECIES: hypothetical protein [Virgibacillus]|uniref:Uncharacterized protein n=2 Tax=Virgibacillus TaxID=84406 RepID=A0A024Q7G2_9BACI|nr:MULTISPECIES: hypothetical protein [Virgibacillus]EQB38331.1 hypothetical protein M948_07060 [Virgibacillus sp. CM-4]MYL41039.1 hypothetical protein [Virgibacillus massiliensis]GGJ53785.1 hypothetical protein GCM10007111_14980 [Virgibacillus kapii]CDQ38160.1 hypothetical protein BN990_00427 [Virgibacillus massiliensis]
MAKNTIERGQSITFRVPSDTPDYLLKQMQRLKETERRNFSSQIAQFVLKGLSESFAKERETITVPLPKRLTKEQKSWLKHEHSEALIGSILYHLLSDPMRATTLLASLNSNSTNIDEALYLQEAVSVTEDSQEELETPIANHEIDLENLSMDALETHDEPVEVEEEEEEDPLKDFFSSMNK